MIVPLLTILINNLLRPDKSSGGTIIRYIFLSISNTRTPKFRVVVLCKPRRFYSIFFLEASLVSWKVIKVDSQKDESICIPRYCIFMVS